MDMGEKIRKARLEAGLSQRQLCGEEITRNMLSLIENGGARPSMKTLGYLSRQLGKPLSYFLEENAPDPSELAESAENLRRAEEALAEGKVIYGAQLLEQVTSNRLQREKWMLLARIPGADLVHICGSLPSLDEELLLRAEAALREGKTDRSRCLLDAAEDQEIPRWNLLRGRAYMAEGQWSKAAACLEKAGEEDLSVIGLLEVCFRELGDYRRAYEYACRQKR